jgi:fermentation-respiration switch protein FrsA (DUF1100 family)
VRRSRFAAPAEGWGLGLEARGWQLEVGGWRLAVGGWGVGSFEVRRSRYMAGARSFGEWYLFTPKREGAERDAFIVKLAPLDPIAHLAKISPRPVLLQFGTKDPFVKNEAATAIVEAVQGPKTVKMYEFEHELTFQARLDRIAWLKEQFKLAK